MVLFDLREPVNALSHGAGMVLALPLTWAFWRHGADRTEAGGGPYHRGKRIALLVFGFSLAICYGNSAVYHAARTDGPSLNSLRRLDHVGIYLLIAGTYTPAAWTLMRHGWRQGTLATVWSLAIFCAGRVWFGGILPTWISTLTYLALGWGVLLCYRELARELSHRTLRPLPLGGAFYSVGALINLSGRPALVPGAFGAHELFHFFVLAGSACHAYFMFRVVVPARQPADWEGLAATFLDRTRPATTRFDAGARWLRRPLASRLLRGAALVEAVSVDGVGVPEPSAILNPAEP